MFFGESMAANFCSPVYLLEDILENLTHSIMRTTAILQEISGKLIVS